MCCDCYKLLTSDLNANMLMNMVAFDCVCVVSYHAHTHAALSNGWGMGTRLASVSVIDGLTLNRILMFVYN